MVKGAPGAAALFGAFGMGQERMELLQGLFCPRRHITLVGLAGLLAGCTTLPISGPTGHEVLKESANPKLGFSVVEIAQPADLPAPPVPPPLALTGAPPPTDLVGPNDVLDIAIFEAGVTLFAPGARVGTAERGETGQTAAAASGAEAQRLPGVRVDDAGFIRLPYVGRMRAAGHTTSELAEMIRDALRGLSQNPQVQVAFSEHISGTVLVGGEVIRPGRLLLTTNRESLSDTIALSGGYKGEAVDLVARVTRGHASYDYRLADVLSGPARDMQMSPGDRVEVVHAPQSFSVLGAPNNVNLMPFKLPEENLAEAVAAAGGASPNLGDAKAIFVFRFVLEPGAPPKPVVYHINMMHPGAYFLAQHFAMRDKDVLYIGNAASNQPGKFIQLVSQLFSPIVAVQSGLTAAGVIK